MSTLFKFLSLFSILLFPLSALAQDLEAIAKAKPIQVSGGFGTDHVFYQANGIDQRRNAPYQYYLNGNINFQFYGQLSVPLSFSYSNQKFNYTQPLNQQRFNQFGISPKYRWITAHIGWRSMTFSPYSLSGHTFAGGGVELTPGKWKIALLGGRFLKAVEYDSSEVSNKPSYQRMGMGMNVAYEDKGNAYGFSLFRSTDQVNSLKTSLDSIGVTPEDNFVWDVKVKQQLVKKLFLEGEFANSSITRDTRYSDEYKARYQGIISENTTTVDYQAYKFGMNYQMAKAKIGMTFEHIDPGYRTHGAYYFNNDLENITLNYARPFFKNKVQFGFNIGKQRNNLDNSKLSTMLRWVGSANLGWQISKKINIGMGYSNFRSYTNMRTPFTVLNSANPYQNIDTLNFVQITQSISGNLNYAIVANQKRVQNLSLNASTQNASDQQGGKDLPTGSVFYNGTLAYQHTLIKPGIGFNLAVNGNWNQNPQSDTKLYGPTAGLSKSFFKKKLQSNLSYSWNTTLVNDATTGSISSLRFTSSYSIKKKHSFNLSAIWLNKVSTTTPSFDEYTVRVGYNFRF